MKNPFDKVPSSTDEPKAVDNKTLKAMATAFKQFETTASHLDSLFKNQEELGGVVFETFLDDDGSFKDIAHSAEIRAALRHHEEKMERLAVRVETAASQIPTQIEARLNDDDRASFDNNLLSWKRFFKLYCPAILGIGAVVGICIMGCIMVTNSASSKKEKYEQQINQLDSWYQENAAAISFGTFYRENYPKNYREWQTGRWQQDIAYRDSLIRATSLDRLKRLHQD